MSPRLALARVFESSVDPGCRRCQSPCGYGYVIIHTYIHADTWFQSGLTDLWGSNDNWLVARASSEYVLSLAGRRFRSYTM